MQKDEVIDKLEQMGVLLELAGENPFKVRAFQNGAKSLAALEAPWPDVVLSGALKSVKGIGTGLFHDISTLVTTGQWPAFEALVVATPNGLLELLELPGLGPKKVRALHEGLGISSVGELEYAIAENRLLELPGFGTKTQSKLGEAIAFWKRHRHQRLLVDVLPAAVDLVSQLERVLGVPVGLAGDLRRRCEVLDRIVVWADGIDAERFLERLVTCDGVENHAEELFFSGLPLEVIFLNAQNSACALLYATGNGIFLNALEERARGLGLRLTAEALWRGDQAVELLNEDDVFASLGLWTIPPEARESDNLALWERRDPEPRLLVLDDIKGAFHVHSTYSDGSASLRELVRRAIGLGWHYIGISDHSESAVYARGLRLEKIAEQRAEIAELQTEFSEIRIFAGIEADILADGRLDYDDETLAGFDFVIGSIHSRHGHDAETMTHRLTRALSNPYLTMLGHLSGRLLLARDAYAFDMDAVLNTAARYHKAIELNANPHRLDLDWRILPQARALNIPIMINPDAHSLDGLEDLRWGVAMARKASMKPADVWNTLSADKLAQWLKI